MKKHIADRPYSEKVTNAVLYVIDAIKRKRKPGLITDKDIAKHIDNMAHQTLHYWRNGDRAITLDQLGAFIHAFDVNPVFLLKQEGTPWGEAELTLRVKQVEDKVEELSIEVGELQKSGKKRP